MPTGAASKDVEEAAPPKVFSLVGKSVSAVASLASDVSQVLAQAQLQSKIGLPEINRQRVELLWFLEKAEELASKTDEAPAHRQALKVSTRRRATSPPAPTTRRPALPPTRVSRLLIPHPSLLAAGAGAVRRGGVRRQGLILPNGEAPPAPGGPGPIV